MAQSTTILSICHHINSVGIKQARIYNMILRSGSKPVDDVFSKGFDSTPRPATQSLPLQSGSSIKRSRGKAKRNLDTKPTAPLKERDSPLFLEKPVHIKSLTRATSQLPGDVRDLYRRIHSAAVYKEAILPPEMREEISTLLDDEAREASFPKLLAATDGKGSAKAAAWLLHTQVCETLEAAEMVDLQKRHECSWNAHVHATVLGLVFTLLLSRAGFRPQQPRRVAARYEAVQATTITWDSAPHWKDGSPAARQPCVEKSEVRFVYLVKAALLTWVVDDEPLQQAIRRAAFNNETKTCYVNQTSYNPIFDTPISVSIQTKKTSPNDDPLLQLGLWFATWHKRMYALRQQSFSPPLLGWLPESMRHEWSLYFACDYVTSISLYGPIGLGSMRIILDLYTLVTCLLIKDWTETEFL
ncbi:hypothetical protein GGR58DRAFT_504590 [Xylaria digitata]|nr:hypothetical protein GGR58DRAFT_504590 [Xylaria digitata]